MVIDELEGQVELCENDAPGAAALLQAMRLPPEDRGSDGRRLVGHGARSHGGRSCRRPCAWGIGAIISAVALFYAVPWVDRYLKTVSTEDAFVNGHVSTVSARIPDIVEDVLVDDNDYVERGTILVRLDRAPFALAVERKKAFLEVTRSDLERTRAEVRAEEAKMRGSWFALVWAQEQARCHLATLRADVANLAEAQAEMDLARKEAERETALASRHATPIESLEQRKSVLEAAQQRVAGARALVQRSRADLGLGPNSEHPLAIREDLLERLSTVQVAMAGMAESLAQIGVPLRLDEMTPSKLDDRVKAMDPSGDLDRGLDAQVARAPATLLALAKVHQAEKDVAQAELDLSYTEIKAPIAGFVSRRTVNPGNHVDPGQAIMRVRSLQEIWIDANFKETELGQIRIGQPVDIYVDSYPERIFRGRVSGFSPGTGATMALLPPENATGNFVKVVQRLPVRIELTEQPSAETPLFAGLSVTPVVRLDAKPQGPDAGQRLRHPAVSSPRSVSRR
jgi:membrane fusion protein, multidrug efflux system